MKIRFLKVCKAPQERWEEDNYFGYQATWFELNEELDPDRLWARIDLSGLKFGEDYEIVEYP